MSDINTYIDYLLKKKKKKIIAFRYAIKKIDILRTNDIKTKK
jgi:hypothetical protein